MELIRGIQNLTDEHRPSVVSIGNYDGVHLGHQHVIKTLLEKSAKLAAASTIVTFEPLAKEFFMPDSVVRLSSVEQRAEQLFALGVDRVLCIDFDAEFAAYSPQKFVQSVLVEGLGVRYLSVGDDFRFGKDRVGDFEFLSSYAEQHDFTVTAHQTFSLQGERVSSGRVREALAAGDFKLAQKLLGRPYSISGLVSLGRQLGRTLGFPTANIVLDAGRYAVNGVYAVQVRTAAEEHLSGVANIGTRPTVDGSEYRLEVHIFDYDGDLYGQQIDTRFIQKIRDEVKFDSLALLREQINQDAQHARQICAATNDHKKAALENAY